MKAVLALISIIVLSACVTPQQKPIDVPERFLGIWQPISAASNVNIFVHENGKIEYLSSNNKNVLETSYYRVIHHADPKDIYLAVYSPVDESYPDWARKSDRYQFMRLVLEDKEYDPSTRYLRWHTAYYFKAEQWDSLTDEELWACYQTQFKQAKGWGIDSEPYAEYDDKL